ncbi:DEAD/DEAH box helicase [Ornithinimicrobium sp. INDO-MA30-4]|uniref:DEAD/DEAH box helicase n=1 Tax=Ornithinimicrobium sp. INDO-MA30-4 TaxID=2908651 RepID=UPI001F22E1E7|nr:DEAD/DEAH box helicase [Ornithinimicrobium sp. INDO-MA30-4]UJH69561.1 DEAD/DEAH box helicase [Ornithinimicrobium sp. INDO-MA30-4]
MSELLPSLQARDLREGLVDYLTTTFALVDPEPRRALREFLDDESDGIFKGPYLRLRLPFRPADAGWQSSLDWLPEFTPYRHQAQAYERLTTKGRFDQGTRPEPTLVTTGTGSGKTESFLHPILDHVLRAKRAGVTGTKALILYPMNALADDQAGRLTELLTTDPALAGVTAGIYTGGQTREDTRVSSRGLITSRHAMRDQAPDILLTNYKMLDQLLLRPDDQSIWAQSALSLTYLVLDEFHTYDGAQGTDVAMLLRRLGIALKSHWPDEHPEISPADRARPMGKMTPVATSATLGDDTDASAMLAFAHTVFGEEIAPDAVITETRQSWAQWSDGAQAPAPSRLREMSGEQLSQVAAAASDHADDPAALTGAVLACLHTESIEQFEPLDLIKSTPTFRV